MTLRSKSRSLLLSLVLLALVLVPTLPLRAQSSTGIFEITLMVPQPNPARQEWSLVVQNNLQALGIDAQRVVLDWPTIYSRALTPNPS
ncbi:MAG TPA: hypothetical protein VFJ63_04420, partial [Candidatus Bathyarchaeia archaeon]|nr:hypothetical protein [Candidatus Bathyarchaeia archaeon]